MRILILLLLAGTLPLAAAEQTLTLYNEDFAVVRDTVHLDLKAGINETSLSGVTATVEPDSVILRDPAGQAQFQIVEQNYRNDPVSEQIVLSHFEGKAIDFIREEPNKPDQTIRARIVRSGFVPGGTSVEPIIERDGKLQFKLPGRPVFPSLGEESILKPTLDWKLAAPAPAKVDAQIAYVTSGFSWSATYNLVAPGKGEVVDFIGWVTMHNESGASFVEAKIKLMAGNVNKVHPPKVVWHTVMAMLAKDGAAAVPTVTEKAFDEFHLYSLDNPVTLRDKETKQVEFVRATKVKAERIYIYDGADLYNWRTGMMMGADPAYGTQSNKKVAVYRSFKNSEGNHLGIPLPKGRMRFYSQDADQQLEFVGENDIDHTPRNEVVRLFAGDSFDLVGERKRTDFKIDSDNRRAQESFQITVRNRKAEPAAIRVVEHLYRWANWEITGKSQEFTETDSQSIEFQVPLEADEEKHVTYTVHYSW